MQSEKQYVIASFHKNFSRLAGQPIAIYGVGKNTKHIIDNFPGHSIAGLMDEARTGETIFGKPVLSAGEVAARGVKAIVIVARAGNTRLIYRRIAGFAGERSIAVYDINGNVLGAGRPAARSFKKYSGVSEEALRGKISRADAVSFDVFDTLVMRRCLYPRDVFHMMGAAFAKARIKAEADLCAEGGQPTIYDIYERMGAPHTPQAELDAEAKCLAARGKMLEMLDYATALGKDVYLVSDMYLPKEILAPLLENLGVRVAPGRVLVSCDCGLSKADGLFGVLRAKAGGGRILHVGDNYEADVRCAERSGIDDVFHIGSALSMLEDSWADKLLQYDGTLENRRLVGEFTARRLNDPFLFAATGGRFEARGNYEMAYSFIAPLIHCFFAWMADKARAMKLDLVLLASRDGWVIERVHEALCGDEDLPPMKYFYTSRAAAVISGLFTDEDILHAARLAYAGTAAEMLRDRFHLRGDELSERGDEDDGAYVLRHRDAILREAGRARRNYRRYVDTLGVPQGARVGFFDFISSGTCQKALEGIVDFDLFGLYVAALNVEAEYKSHVPIDAMYGSLNAFEKTYCISENYFLLESILSSREATVAGFDERGAPVFFPECRTEADLSDLGEAQDAIIDYVRHSGLRLHDLAKVDRALPDALFGLLEPTSSIISAGCFAPGEMRDEFCNRAFARGG
jgi:FMN phosphatase YigB (HAD superfamily)